MSTKKTINCDIAEDTHRAARHRSLDTGETLGEIITVALREYLMSDLQPGRERTEASAGRRKESAS